MYERQLAMIKLSTVVLMMFAVIKSREWGIRTKIVAYTTSIQEHSARSRTVVASGDVDQAIRNHLYRMFGEDALR